MSSAEATSNQAGALPHQPQGSSRTIPLKQRQKNRARAARYGKVGKVGTGEIGAMVEMVVMGDMAEEPESQMEMGEMGAMHMGPHTEEGQERGGPIGTHHT
jgi:hypothetical protein